MSGYVIWCVATCALALWAVLDPRRRDPLEPVKLVAALHGLGFGLGPLVLAQEGVYALPYLGSYSDELLDRGAMLAFFALAAFLLGYGGRAQSSAVVPRQASASPALLVTAGGALLGIGLTAYAAIIAAGGGLAAFATYSGGRAEIFQLQGIFGGLYWATFLMVAGVCAVGAAWAPRHPWLCCALGLGVALAFAPFQGRDEILAPLFCTLILMHYLHRAIKARWLVLGCAAAASVAMIVGYYRGLDEIGKAALFASPGEVASELQAGIGEQLQGLLAKNIEQMDTFLVAQRYFDINPQPLYGQTFLHWLEPIDRQLLGGLFHFDSAGRILAELLNPDHRYLVTAASPSMVGELYLNFGALGLLLGAAVWGRALGASYRWMRHRGHPAAIIVYPYVAWVLSKATIDGSVLFFRIVVVGLPLFVVYLMLRRQAPATSAVGADESASLQARPMLASHEVRDGMLMPIASRAAPRASAESAS
ncbi:MAG TPA: hypothetical protein VJQ52_18960 [Steroidobacteraceae bacterium]|nr:hypothetical protein [Steroidobacteraceae bacterium]